MRTFAIALALLMLIPGVALAQHRPGGGGGGFHHDGGGGFHRPGGGGWNRGGGGHWPGVNGGWYGPGNDIAGGIIGGVIGSWLFPREPEVVVVPQQQNSVEWCMSRYRSYNPQTHVYLGFDGQFHGCP